MYPMSLGTDKIISNSYEDQQIDNQTSKKYNSVFAVDNIKKINK